MTYDKTVHLRLSAKQMKYIDDLCIKKSQNKSEIIRVILNKAIKKDGRKKK